MLRLRPEGGAKDWNELLVQRGPNALRDSLIGALPEEMVQGSAFTRVEMAEASLCAALLADPVGKTDREIAACLDALGLADCQEAALSKLLVRNLIELSGKSEQNDARYFLTAASPASLSCPGLASEERSYRGDTAARPADSIAVAVRVMREGQ
jgi:hypothetical protein